MIGRILGIIRLNPHAFEDVENDTGATLQAMAVVVLVSIATGLGQGISTLASGEGNFLLSLLFGIIFGLIGWAVWAFVVMLVGTTILKTPDTHADWGQLARGTGFAQAPGLLKILAFIPGVGPVIFFAAQIWQLIAMVTAVRQCLDYTSTWRAIGVVLIGFVVVVIIGSVLAVIATSLGILAGSFEIGVSQ